MSHARVYAYVLLFMERSMRFLFIDARATDDAGFSKLAIALTI